MENINLKEVTKIKFKLCLNDKTENYFNVFFYFKNKSIQLKIMNLKEIQTLFNKLDIKFNIDLLLSNKPLIINRINFIDL